MVTDQETFVIEDVATLKALADPHRLRLLTEMADSPKTVKQLADWLGVPKTRLYYHVRKLEEHGLVRVTGRRVVSGIEERTYAATAKNWTVSDEMWSSSVVRSGVLASLMNMAAAELSLAFDRQPTLARGEPNTEVPLLVLTRLFLSEDDVAEVQKRLASIMDDFFDRPDDGSDKVEYHALFATYKAP